MEKHNISLMVIDKIIVHDVPKHFKKDISKTVDYSQKESKLTPQLKNFFKDKITEAIIKKGFKVYFDESTVSPVPKLINILNTSSRKTIVKPSQNIAKHLLDIQSGINPAGIVVVIVGKIETNNITAILKLERDEGARLHKYASRHIINIESVKDLMLTKKTKLYKVGFFFVRNDYKVDFDGYLSDNQLEIDSRSIVAKFFLENYLGCKIYGDTRTETKQFFDVTKAFILNIEEPIKKAKYYEHLMSYSNKSDNVINPKEFCVDYFDEDDRQAYEEHLKQNHIDTSPFLKNTELIQNHLKKMLIDFENDISIISKNGEIGDKVKLSKADDGDTIAEIKSKITNISS